MEGGHNAPSVTPPGSTTTVGATATPVGACDSISLTYHVSTACICGVCFVLGVLFCFFGYRLFRLTLFLTGFLFGSLVTFLICQEEQLLSYEGKIGVSVAAGVLCGLITMLVQYVGVFMTGFHLGLLLGIATLTVLEQFYHPSTKWLCVGVMFGTGLLFALLALKFQKGLTIVSSCMVGGAMIACALDYFVENLAMAHYVWERVLAEFSGPVCWFSWILLALWPATVLVGMLAQCKVTARGHTLHKQGQKRFEVQPSTSAATAASTAPTATESHSVVEDSPPATQAFIPAPPSGGGKRQKLDLAKARKKGGGGSSSGGGGIGDGFLTLSSKYRHLYRVRRCNGDVIAQTPQLQNVVIT